MKAFNEMRDPKKKEEEKEIEKEEKKLENILKPAKRRVTVRCLFYTCSQRSSSLR